MVYGVDIYTTPIGVRRGAGSGKIFVNPLHEREVLRRGVLSSHSSAHAQSHVAERRLLLPSRSDARRQTTASCTSIAILQQLTGVGGGGSGGDGGISSEVSADFTDLSLLPMSDLCNPSHHPANAVLEGAWRAAALEYHDVVKCSNVNADSRTAPATVIATAASGGSVDSKAIRGNVVSYSRLHATSSPSFRSGPTHAPASRTGDADVTTIIHDVIRDILNRGDDVPFAATSPSHPLLQQAVRMCSGSMTPAGASGGATARLFSTTAGAASPLQRQESRPTVYVTGGLGAIGLEVASWLVDRKPGSRVCLSGRTGRATSEGHSTLRRLCGGSADGGMITVFRCDAAIDEECRHSAQIMRSSDRGKFLEGVTSVIHASGVLADAMLPRQQAGGVREVSDWGIGF